MPTARERSRGSSALGGNLVLADVGRRARRLPVRPRRRRQHLFGVAGRHATCAGTPTRRVLRALPVDRRHAHRLHRRRADLRCSTSTAASPRRSRRCTPSTAPQTARRFVEISRRSGAVRAESRRHGARARLARPAVHDAAVGRGGRRSTAPAAASAIARRSGCTTASASCASATTTASSASRSTPRCATSEPPVVTTGDIGRVTELAASPTDDVVAFANHRHELVLVDLADGKRARSSTAVRRRASSDLAFSPDGRWLAYCLRRQPRRRDRAQRRDVDHPHRQGAKRQPSTT